MARKPRIHFPGALYHVIVRGNQGQTVFHDAGDYQRYLRFLREYKEHFDFLLYAYVLMPTHVHLVLDVHELLLSRLMQSLLFRYARYFSKRYGQVGHLFQGRYRAILCDKDCYLLELMRYIHLNPVRTKIVADPAHYVSTSHQRKLTKKKYLITIA